ncbi:flocculation protein FLO11-like [Cucumis melo var. makuwa]|uniref:Flocculation protein FLO11-like n=1 Tax=Cucumis melo var. makuwa TaxID=1194695 RepID=A0A5D3DWZ8_CUCMM|nr:flocculation protein FLO11-like [Cucumis melo var. makuwa]TYK28213.1 flocculation protein FLO11-like [Cucumis melo var. makuwa]
MVTLILAISRESTTRALIPSASTPNVDTLAPSSEVALSVDDATSSNDVDSDAPSMLDSMLVGHSPSVDDFPSSLSTVAENAPSSTARVFPPMNSSVFAPPKLHWRPPFKEQKVITTKVYHRKLPQNAPSIPIDGLSFHSECA